MSSNVFNYLRVLLFVGLCALAPAAAQDRPPGFSYPPALRVGLAPPPNFVPSVRFPGFEHNDRPISIVLTELPGYTFESIENDVNDDMAKAPGVITRENIELKSGAKGFILRGVQTSPQGPLIKWTQVVREHDITGIVVVSIPEAVKEAAPEEAIRASLATMAIRATVPTEEQLAVLPFSMNDLAGYRIVRVQPGNAAMLTEGPKDAIEVAEQPLILVTIAPMQQAPPAQERDGIARRMVGETPGLKEMRVIRSEPLRVAHQQGHEVLVEAKDTKTGNDITAIQWIRFGSGTFLRIVAVSRKDAWDTHYPRFRAFRDGIGPKS